MRFISLHCDYIRFRTLKKALKQIPDLDEKDKKGESKNCLVILVAVEKGDSKKNVSEFVKNIKEISEQVKTKNIVLYPYAHLSSNLSNPNTAIEFLKEAEKKLKKIFKVLRAPFGYYKEFELKVKGHPLSELSREIKGEEKESDERSDVKQILREISKAKLDTSKLKDNDHRIIGKQMDLFSFHDVAPGMVFWHNNGLIIREELIKFARETLYDNGYEEISTPQIMDKKLWQLSGHWDKYKENNFLTDYEKRKFLVKPMNCPGGMLVYKSNTKSYRDLPLRVGEFGIVHRQELSGVLAGLFRVVQFIQDDAHIFCTDDQLPGEIVELIRLMGFFYKKFGLKYRVELSTRPSKRIGSKEMWDKAERILEDVLKKKKIKYKLNKGDGAFYGPKIDFHVSDSLDREWQLGTIQLDFSLPERFNLEYTDKDNKKKRPVMLHRTIYGSLERFIGVIIEHYKGLFPTWLSPVQIKILTMSDKNIVYARKVLNEFKNRGIRVKMDDSGNPIPKKVRSALIEKVNYIVTIGDKEQKAKTLAIRGRDGKVKFGIKLDKFIKDIKKEIEDRK